MQRKKIPLFFTVDFRHMRQEMMNAMGNVKNTYDTKSLASHGFDRIKSCEKLSLGFNWRLTDWTRDQGLAALRLLLNCTKQRPRGKEYSIILHLDAIQRPFYYHVFRDNLPDVGALITACEGLDLIDIWLTEQASLLNVRLRLELPTQEMWITNIIKRMRPERVGAYEIFNDFYWSHATLHSADQKVGPQTAESAFFNRYAGPGALGDSIILYDSYEDWLADKAQYAKAATQRWESHGLVGQRASKFVLREMKSRRLIYDDRTRRGR